MTPPSAEHRFEKALFGLRILQEPQVAVFQDSWDDNDKSKSSDWNSWDKNDKSGTRSRKRSTMEFMITWAWGWGIAEGAGLSPSFRA